MSGRLTPGLLLGVVLSFSSTLATSGTGPTLDVSKQPVALGEWGEYWLDTGAQLGPVEVAATPDAAWRPTQVRGIYPLMARQALWIRFTVPPAPDTERWLLEIPYPALDRASLYTLDKAGQWNEQRSGDLTAVNLWPTPHRHPLLLINFNAEEPTRYLLRVENAQGFSAPVRFVSARRVLRDEQQISFFLGVYFGLAALGCAIGLLGAVWLRDRAYLYYGACAALVGLTQAAITGVAALHLWPDAPQWADRSLALLATWMLVSLLLLNATVVSLAQRSRLLNTLVWVVAGAGMAVSVALGVTDSSLRLPLVVPFMVVAPLLILAVNLWAWRHGDPFSVWLVLSAAPFAVALSLAIARYLQWIPLSLATEQGILASMALELPAVLAVLIMRSQQRRENQRRIFGLDRIDPTTGLINGHVFTERLLRMVARSERHHNHSAVILIDIINTEQTQREFGRKAADELPLRVASRLLSIAREIDSAARLSERRFGMLVEGPFSAEDAATLGPRIVARCLMPYKGLHLDCVAQVRVAYALVPYHGAGNQSLLSRLEDRLASAANSDDKRAVFMLAETVEDRALARQQRWRKSRDA